MIVDCQLTELECLALLSRFNQRSPCSPGRPLHWMPWRVCSEYVITFIISVLRYPPLPYIWPPSANTTSALSSSLLKVLDNLRYRG